MTLGALAFGSLVFYWRTHAAVACGVAAGVAVLAGALLVGGSVRESLADIAAGRLGRADLVLTAERPFTEALSHRLLSSPRADDVTALLALEGAALAESSGRRAAQVHVYGVDRRFFSFHHVSGEPPDGSGVLFSPDLSAELGAAPGDTVLVRVTRPTDIPIDSLQGRKDDAARVLRLRYHSVLDRGSMGEFSLGPTQGPVRAVFVALSTLQHDLDLAGRANVALFSGGHDGTSAASLRSLLPSRLDADDYGLRFNVETSTSTIVAESASGLVPDVVASAVDSTSRGESLDVTPVLTWLANRLTVSGRSVPYSLVAALGPTAAGDLSLGRLLGETSSSTPPIVLNDWAARDLQAAPGATVDLEYYRWLDEGRLVTEHASFQLAGVVPMTGLAVDRRLAPDFPGITDSDSVSDWNPPFPIDLKQVRPADEEYWRRFRTAPKAFVPLAIGRRLWGTRHGHLTSLRLRPTMANADLEQVAARLRTNVPRVIDPFRAGFTVIDVRAQSTAASTGTSDFGIYFASFSLFLVVSSLLMTGLFFRLSIEQRLTQIGILRATGYSLAVVRRLFLREGLFVALAGAALGAGLAILWAALMMYGLRTWWVDAVGTSRLELHLDLLSLASGVSGGLAAGAISIALTLRALGRASPRELLTGARDVVSTAASGGSTWIAAAAFTAAAALTVGISVGLVPAAGGFFGAGALMLTSGLAAFRRWLARRHDVRTRSSWRLVRLGLRNASWRPGRSLTVTGLVAAAVFLIVAVDAFKRDTRATGPGWSGSGGFALIGESVVPMVHDPSTPEGREALGLSLGSSGSDDLAGVDLIAARLRPGDDTSCLNLYQPTRPRVVGLSDRFIDANRFRFSRSIAASDSERRNPWRLLHAPVVDGAIPAIADATSLEYVLHASVGDVIVIDGDTARPLRLRIVAALSDSVLQGELLISEQAFLAVFPEVAGYRLLLIDVIPEPRGRLDHVARVLESRLEPVGLDVQETARQLAAYYRVENTYLSTFQALGGLGLLLGVLGLAAVVARNLLERRRELAVLGAAGYTGRDLQVVVLSENLALVAAGLVIGIVAASIAIGPILIARASGPPQLPLVWLAMVLAAALLSGLWSTRSVRRLRLVESLRSE